MRVLGDQAWPDVRTDAVLLIPLGSTEQHGPHLPLSTDTDIAVGICTHLATDRPDIVIAPAIAIGASGEHQDFPGTLSIGHDALTTLLVELVRSASTAFDRIAIVNAHGGNSSALRDVTELLHREGHEVVTWSAAYDGGDAHAGRGETSLMLALRPELVGADRTPGDVRPLRELMPDLRRAGVRAVSPSGVLGDPRDASAAEGTALLAGLVHALGAALQARWPDRTSTTTDEEQR